MANMFQDLAKTAKTTKAKKKDKPTIRIQGDEFDANLKAFVDLKRQFDNVKTQLTLVQGYIKDETLGRWYKLYETNRSYPGSVLVTSDSESSFMFAPSDKYLTINDERARELKGRYGDDIVTENVKFSFNSQLLEKYAEVLTNLIQNSNDIDEEDKMNLIVAEKSLSVSKGSIEKALTTGKGDVKSYLEDIQPVYSLRTPKTK